MTKHIEPFIIVVDNRNSALALVAQQRSKIHLSEICYASDFISPSALLNYLLESSKTRILFAWRGALREALSINSSTGKYKKLLEKKTVHMLVPDLLGTHVNFLPSETRLVNVTHGYWVTSLELSRIYTQLFPLRAPLGVLHDIPDVSLILTVRKLNLRRSGIIWVGNSKWGSNYGYVDHKGYASVIQPLVKKKLQSNPFKVRDSSVERAPNDQVLREIAESEMLIQASAHEGTGLPLLEALGVGTIPITTDVGIAREVLLDELEHLIIERNVQSFEQKINELGTGSVELSRLCVSAYDNFIARVSGETIQWNRSETDFPPWTFDFVLCFKIRLTWVYRFFQMRRNR